MLTLCIYCLSEDYYPQITVKNSSDPSTRNFPMCLNTNDFANSLKTYLDNFKELEDLDSLNDSIYLFSLYSKVSDQETRAEIISEIYTTVTNKYEEKDLKDNFIIKFYLILPEGESFLISNFDKINEHIDYINSSSKEKMLKELDKYNDLRIERSKELSPFAQPGISLSELNKRKYDFATTDYLEYSLSEIMNKNMDENQDKYEEEMVQSLVKTRNEEYGDDIKNELDLVNKIMVDNDINMNNSEIVSCKYNGEDISVDDICLKLHSHTFPQYLTQINIQDTLDDEYDIVTSNGTIHRSKGGKISLSN